MKKTIVLNNAGSTNTFDESLIHDELEVVQSIYPHACVQLPTTSATSSSPHASFGGLTMDIPVQWSATSTASKVTIAVELVHGYPFVLPNLSVDVHVNTSARQARGNRKGEQQASLPVSDSISDISTVATWDVEAIVQSRLMASVREAISAAISAGQPCLLQLLAHVEDFFSQDPTAATTSAHLSTVPSSPPQDSGATSSKKSVAFLAPSYTTAPAASSISDESFRSQQKQLRRLAALTLHLTQKCCELYSKDSAEEANDNFVFLKQYLTDEVSIVPKEINEKWDARKMLKAGFSTFVDTAEENDDVRLCLKWFWGTSHPNASSLGNAAGNSSGGGDASAFTFDQRFSHDFIQQRRVGAGGFAPVFICRKIIDGKLYAVKKVAVLTHQSARALREVQMLAALDHENIVRYYDAWAEPGVDKDLESFVDAIEDEAEECEESDESTLDEESSEYDQEEDVDSSDESVEDDSESSSSEELHLPPSSHKPSSGYRSAAASFFDSDDDDSHTEDKSSRNGCSNGSTPALGSATPTTAPSSTRGGRDDVRVRQSSTSDNSSKHGTAQQQQSHRLFTDGQRGASSSSFHHRYRTLYIQMELCQAATLRHLIDSGKLLEENGGEQLAASIFRQLLMVVAHVHAQQVVHRDLKPDNVLFQQQQASSHQKSANASPNQQRSGAPDVSFGAIKVADFGLARSMPKALLRSRSADMDDLASSEGGGISPISNGAGSFFQLRGAGSFDESTPPRVQVTTNCGTVLYCAPEQADGSTYDIKVDDYSVGMIALEMWLAVAGRDFRERFIILNQVTRSQGLLPMWFQQWRPKIAEIISSLIQVNPRKRSTCDAILARQDLPGEPAEVSQALHTIAQFGPKMTSRVFQRLEEHAIANFRRRPVPSSSLDSLKQTSLRVQRLLEMTATLHCGTPLPFLETLLPLAPPLKQLASSVGNVALMDDSGKFFLSSTFPHLSVASYLSAHRGSFHEDSFSFVYNNKSSRPSFNFGTLLSPTTMDVVLQPVLYALDVVSSIEVSEGSKMIITLFTRSDRCQSTMSFEDESLADGAHADHHDAVHQQGPSAGIPPRTRQHVASTEDLRDYLSSHEQDFSPDDLHDLKKMAHAVFSALPQLYSSTSAMPLIFISSQWGLDDDAPVDLNMLTGVSISCEVMTGSCIQAPTTSAANAATTGVPLSSSSPSGAPESKKRNHSTKKPSAPSTPSMNARDTVLASMIAAASTRDGDAPSCTTLIAIGCHLLPFAALFNSYHDTHAFMVTLDIASLQSVTRRVLRNVLSSNTVLDGVVVSTGDGATSTVAPDGASIGSAPGTVVPTAAALQTTSGTSLSTVSSCGVTSEVIVLLTKLWAAGHRVFPRSKLSSKDIVCFKETSLSRQHSWWITEALKLLWIPSVVSNKANRHEVRYEVHLESLVKDVRTIMAAAASAPGSINPHHHHHHHHHLATGGHSVAPLLLGGGAVVGGMSVALPSLNGATNVGVTVNGITTTFSIPTSMKVDFTGREDSSAVQEARESLMTIMGHAQHSTILAVLCTSSEVRRCFSDFLDSYERSIAPGAASSGPSPGDGSSCMISPSLVPRSGGVGVQAFMDWLRRHFLSSVMCLIPVFCLADKRMELLVHPQRLKQLVRGKCDPSNGRKNGGDKNGSGGKRGKNNS